MKHLPTLKQLQYLLALADEQSFSRAAETCNVTQSTLSAGISALENTLGQPLVARAHKNLVLTPLGEETVAEARKLVNAAEKLTERARLSGRPLSGPLRLGVIPTVAPYMLPQILPALTGKFPALELQIYEKQSANIVADLSAGRLDVLLMAFPFNTPGIEQHVLYEEPFMLAVPQGTWNKKTPVDIADLKGRDLLLLEDGHCLRDHALAACRFQPVQTRRAFNATSLQTLIQMVQAGYGITMLPEMAVKHGALPENIEIFSFKKPLPARQIGLAWRHGSARQKEFELLAEAVHSVFSA